VARGIPVNGPDRRGLRTSVNQVPEPGPFSELPRIAYIEKKEWSRLLIRAMTFNVLTTEIPEEDIENPNDVWSYRADLNVRTILRYRPDVMGFQEFDDGHRTTYREHFGDYDCFDPGTRCGEGSGLAIYWRKAKFRPRDAGTFWLCHDPDVPTADWGLEYPLAATWVTLESVETGAPLLFLDTHYEDGPGGEQMRREGTRILLNQIERIAPGLPSIVVADFNCNPWSASYCLYQDAGFVDTYREAGHGDSAEVSTFHGFRGKEYFAMEWGVELFWRIDWMLLRDGDRHRFQTTSCTIVRDAEPPVYASDHYPVVSEMLLRERGG
jgi:endonuclease/exonuclease/phosphatase family metal-dependent hydrolase